MTSLLERRYKIEIDDFSYIETFRSTDIRNAVVFVHGFRGSNEGTWGTTPSELAKLPLFMQFDLGYFGYETKWIDKKGAPEVADALALWIRTHLEGYDNVYFVAHSMGGLLLRHAIILMLRNADWTSTVKKIRKCFLVATPIVGSAIAKFFDGLWVFKFVNSKTAYLAWPGVDAEDMTRAYQTAADTFAQAGNSHESVPRFHFYAGTKDKVVGPLRQVVYTQFDTYEGEIPGDHGTSKSEVGPNSGLVIHIGQQIYADLNRSLQETKIRMIKTASRKRQKATESAPNAVVQENKAGRDVIVISCSATKSDKAGRLHPGGAHPAHSPEVERMIFDMRSRVLRLIQEGKVDGVEFAQGNRASMPVNQKLIFGPDFGGVINGDRYLPAYERYTGRCYQATSAEWEKLNADVNRPYVLIMSGLYGLIPHDELIQNYDVHLTDVDMAAGISLQTYWRDRELMTQILISTLEWIDKKDGLGKIVEALSEVSYQETINWGLIESRWPVLHRAFANRAGRDALGNLGVWIRDVIKKPVLIKDLEPDVFYENAQFISEDRIAFERSIGRSKLKLAREEPD